MFQRKDTTSLPDTIRTSGRIETVLGQGISIQGVLTGKGGVRIEGTFEGKIDIEGPLVIGEQGKVVAEEIRAPSVVAGGTVQANVIADRVQVLRTGRLYGDVTTANLSTEEGGFLKGTIHMPESKDTAAPADTPTEGKDTTRPADTPENQDAVTRPIRHKT
jgi:cytoskeletal protein CcmA (bactofilin family)